MRATSLRIPLAQFDDRLLREPREHAAIDVVELLHVQTTRAGGVLAELRLEAAVVETGSEVQHESGLARRKADERRVALAPALVHVVIRAEAENARAPHLRRLA